MRAKLGFFHLQVEHGSLAQHLGLVPQPAHHELSDAEWAVVAGLSAARGDSEGCCSICRDLFRNRPQVLLSCSHTFHDRCLRSFERCVYVSCCSIRRNQFR